MNILYSSHGRVEVNIEGMSSSTSTVSPGGKGAVGSGSPNAAINPSEVSGVPVGYRQITRSGNMPEKRAQGDEEPALLNDPEPQRKSRSFAIGKVSQRQEAQAAYDHFKNLDHKKLWDRVATWEDCQEFKNLAKQVALLMTLIMRVSKDCVLIRKCKGRKGKLEKRFCIQDSCDQAMATIAGVLQRIEDKYYLEAVQFMLSEANAKPKKDGDIVKSGV